MKKIFFVLFNILTLISYSFSQQVYKSDEHKFQITFPDGCNLYKDFKDVASVAAYFEKTASINVVVKESDKLKGVADGEYNFEHLLDSVINIYSNTFENFKVVESGNENISDIKFYRISYQCDLAKKVFMATQYFTTKHEKIYVISTGCFEISYEKYMQVFEDCVYSFKFLE